MALIHRQLCSLKKELTLFNIFSNFLKIVYFPLKQRKKIESGFRNFGQIKEIS